MDALLEAVREAPSTIPLKQISAVRSTGHDVVVARDEQAGTAVAFVQPRPAIDVRLSDLTGREREVAALVAAGCSNQQIASALVVSISTVKDHVHAILRKTGLASRTQLVATWYGGLDDDLVS